jgi:NADH-quinone oxidoreductase subunit M
LVAQGGGQSISSLADRLNHIPPPQWRWVALLMLLGFGVKLAVAPLHLWLPDAHSVAPMPVTVLLAGAMLSMGAYGLLRFPLALLPVEELQRLQLPLLLVALCSQVYGALMCLAARDIKRIVAYSSVSQMGYVLFAAATWQVQGLTGGLMHVVSHGTLKALLFIGVGLVMWATGRRNLDELGGLGKPLPAVTGILWVGAIGIVGAPPLCAFYTKWLIISGGLASAYPLLGFVACATPLLTTVYALWLVARLTLGTAPQDLEIRPIPRAMVWSAYLMGGFALAGGLFPSFLYHWGQQAATLLMRGGAW